MPQTTPFYLSDNGFVNTAREASAIRDPESVEMIEEWLREKSIASDKKFGLSSYSLKHRVESDLSKYLTNGAFIQACINVGYKLDRIEGGTNAYVYADFGEMNIIKIACKNLGINYRDLAEQIGYGEGAVKNSAATGKISEAMQRAIELYIENHRLNEENTQFKTIGTALNALIELSKS